LATERLGAARAAPVRRFIQSFYANVPPDDILDDAPENLFGAALSLWSFGAQRRRGSAKVRVYNPRPDDHGWRSPHTVVEIVNDDMPFLVDSVTAALNRRDITVVLVIHPILRLARAGDGQCQDFDDKAGAAESFMQIWITEQPAGEALTVIRRELENVLADVRATVEDWPAMREHLRAIVAEIEAKSPPLPAEVVAEERAFLQWLGEDHFSFLGFREYAFSGPEESAVLSIRPKSSLGILRDEAMSVFDGLRNLENLPPDVRQYLRQSGLVIVTKANRRSTVHRPVLLDTIAVKRFDDRGNLAGERLFIGLFTSVAYSRSPREIPLLRRKVKNCVARAGFEPSSHDAKALQHILETYPRDELFQIAEDDLFDTALGVLHLQERQRIALFIRRDPFERFISCLVYLPRDRYTTELRRRVEAILAEAFAGRIADVTAQMGDSALGRLHIMVETQRGAVPSVELRELEERLTEAARTWADRLQDALVETRGEERGHAALRRFGAAFPSAYREHFSADVAVADIDRVEAALASGRLGLNLYRPPEAAVHEVRLKIYNPGEQLALSAVLPVLEHLGFRVLSEMPYLVRPTNSAGPLWLHDFALLSQDGAEVDLGQVKEIVEEAYARVLAGEMEDDGFNRLVLRAHLSWRKVAMLRAYCKYLRQAGIPFSQSYMEETLAHNPRIARLLMKLFRALFDPAGRDESTRRATTYGQAIEQTLEQVANADQDRILRRYLNAIQSTLRTNYFQQTATGEAKPYLSFKLDSRAVDELPLPRPLYEIFVYSPRLEAIHLRGGKVARGGIRWSDRREDFRTEVLSLMKAQMVKNAVIVPVGSKGGFIVKRPPAGEREAMQAEVVDCYRTMMRGLLDLTDNLSGGQVVPPKDVVRRDEDDPYLVVAADKGTATFSDIANGVAAEYGFWLGDAFASGGSAGYDHKKMAITARGAWESVKRHFREFGHDTQAQDFTVIGIGDMAGDVFGNGMLQSRHIRLVGAFNHLHIFLDPDPDAETGWRERKRLFDLPRSAWSDYDAKLLSPGGAVFERRAKTIRLSPQVKARFGLERDSLTPNELIRVLLTAQTDLLWLGGIGTFVKASDESHADAGDRASDGMRVDASQLRCRVVAEGANLGFTQRARIEYALAGGRLNTDAIDNSAGVDCSDHEVNIKIPLSDLVAQGDMTLKQRDRLLARMTDEVGALVLRDNYLQTQTLSVAQTLGWKQIDQQGRMMRALEKAGRLDRTIEGLPDDETIQERLMAQRGLTRPELAVLLAYGKMALYAELTPSDLPDDPQLEDDLLRYFPEPLREAHKAAIVRHRLRREIIATVVTNSLVNRMGPTFVHVMAEKTAMPASDIARAYAITRASFDLRTLWRAIEALDLIVPSAVQTDMLITIANLAERGTLWFLRNGARPLDLAAHMETYGPGLSALAQGLTGLVGDSEGGAIGARRSALVEARVPEDLAERIAVMPSLAPALDIVRVAKAVGQKVEAVARVYFAVGERFYIDWLRQAGENVAMETHWDRLAYAALLDDLDAHQRELTQRALAAGAGLDTDVGAAIAAWVEGLGPVMQRTETLFAELRQAGTVDLARLAIASRQLRGLVGE
jgi:glutamate dehydrogenase